jgi:putative Holliday junction resolvase
VQFLGVDPGGRRIGLALGNDHTGIVSPLEVIPYEGVDKAAHAIALTAERRGAERIVLGLPVLADGSTGPAARRTEMLATKLRSLGCVVALQGEFLSTNEARRRARETGRSVDRPIDDLAAQVLLEEYLAVRAREAGAGE